MTLVEMRQLALQEMELIPRYPKESQSFLRMTYWLFRMNSLGKNAETPNDPSKVMERCLKELAKSHPSTEFVYDKAYFAKSHPRNKKNPAIEKGRRMIASPLLLTNELRQVLRACKEYWESNPSLPPADRLICYRWVLPIYQQRFGSDFHQSNLHNLAKLGYLKPAHSVRGGGRRYYTLTVEEDKSA
jgi:hypothetical protein